MMLRGRGLVLISKKCEGLFFGEEKKGKEQSGWFKYIAFWEFG